MSASDHGVSYDAAARDSGAGSFDESGKSWSERLIDQYHKGEWDGALKEIDGRYQLFVAGTDYAAKIDSMPAAVIQSYKDKSAEYYRRNRSLWNEIYVKFSKLLRKHHFESPLRGGASYSQCPSPAPMVGVAIAEANILFSMLSYGREQYELIIGYPFPREKAGKEGRKYIEAIAELGKKIRPTLIEYKIKEYLCVKEGADEELLFVLKYHLADKLNKYLCEEYATAEDKYQKGANDFWFENRSDTLRDYNLLLHRDWSYISRLIEGRVAPLHPFDLDCIELFKVENATLQQLLDAEKELEFWWIE